MTTIAVGSDSTEGVKKLSNRNCCVSQCSSRASKDPELSFHKFPSLMDAGDSRREQWILKLRIGKPVTENMLVCSRHFAKSDFILPDLPTLRPQLKKSAIPSDNLPQIPSEVDEGKDKKISRTNVKKTSCRNEQYR